VSRKLTRRTFLGQGGSTTAAMLGAIIVGGPVPLRSLVPAADAAAMGHGGFSDRRWQAYRLRHDAAIVAAKMAVEGNGFADMKAFHHDETQCIAKGVRVREGMLYRVS
jgi:hypothetical protein